MSVILVVPELVGQ